MLESLRSLRQFSVSLSIYIRNTVGFLVELMLQVHVQIHHFTVE